VAVVAAVAEAGVGAARATAETAANPAMIEIRVLDIAFLNQVTD
jgi:hypothetical protein